MATKTSNGTGGGNWSAGATWVGGVAPVPAVDDVVISNGDTVTKDNAANALGDCTAAVINATGILDISTNGLKNTGGTSGTGQIKMGAGSSFDIGGNFSGPTPTFIGSSGSHATVTGAGSNFNFNNIIPTVQFTDFTPRAFFDTLRNNAIFEDSTFTGASIVGNNGSASFIFRRCTFNDTNRCLDVRSSQLTFFECVFGDGTNGAVAGLDLGLVGDAIAYLYNCKFDVTGVEIRMGGTNESPSFAYSESHDQSPGEWLNQFGGGKIMRSTAAAKTGTYGLEFIPSSICATKWPIYVDIPITVATGDDMSGINFYFKNATADMDLEGASNRMTFELDPGNEWGLNELIDASSLSDPFNNWVQVTFTGGTAGGSTDTGCLPIRITLNRYVSTAVVYVADMVIPNQTS